MGKVRSSINVLNLRCFCSDNPRGWFKDLSWAEFWYNTSFHTVIAMTPFTAPYGRDPPSIVRYMAYATDHVDLQQRLVEQDGLLTQLKTTLHKAQLVSKCKLIKDVLMHSCRWVIFF